MTEALAQVDLPAFGFTVGVCQQPLVLLDLLHLTSKRLLEASKGSQKGNLPFGGPNFDTYPILARRVPCFEGIR